MKYLFVFLLIFIVYSCDCPQCEGPLPILRLSFYDIEGNNLLDPGISNHLEILSFKYATGKDIDFIVKDYIIKGYSEGIYHFELKSNRKDSFFQKCLDNDTKFYLTFKNGDIDTLDIKIDEIMDSRCCSHWNMKVSFNGEDQIEADTLVGALIIIK